MKGVSVAVIGGVVLALVGVGVMVALFTDVSPVDADSGFCSVYNGLGPSLPDAITPSVSGCSSGPSIDYRELSNDVTSDELALKIASSSVDCWDEFRGYETEFQRCEAWSVPELDSSVDEDLVTDKMTEHSICPELIENSPGCGEEDNLRFSGAVEGNEYVIIGFNTSSGEQFVEVQ